MARVPFDTVATFNDKKNNNNETNEVLTHETILEEKKENQKIKDWTNSKNGIWNKLIN